MWRTKGSEIPSTSWKDTDALNSQEMIRKIMDHVIEGALIPYYDAHMDERGDSALCFSLADACFVSSDDSARAEIADLPRQVGKTPKNNIYIFI